MTKRAEKREEMRKKMLLKEQQSSIDSFAQHSTQNIANPEQHHIKSPILRFYDKHHKALLILPMLLLLFSIIQISYQAVSTGGDFIHKDISLKGGVGITIPTDVPIDSASLQAQLAAKGFTVSIRNLESAGNPVAFIIESDIDLNDKARIDNLLSSINETYPFNAGEYSVEGVGSSIGQSFFKQAVYALLFSFILMSLVVVISFRTLIPCAAVLLAAVSDILFTIAVANIAGIKVSTAGIAALLMLIGYSVDTDILLTSRVLKRTEGTVLDRIYSSFKTGMMMTLTTLAAVIIALMLTSSDVIRQIMTILLIGLIADMIFTWLQNTTILKLYVDHKNKKKEVQNASQA